MTLPVEIVNGTIRIIQQSDPNTSNLVYATWGIAIATVIGICVTTWYTRNSLKESRITNNLLTLELKTKFKPSFDFDAQILRHKQDDRYSADFLCRMVNNGNVPLRNITISYFASYEEISPTTIISKQSEIEKSSYKVEGTLEPTRYHQLKHTLNMDTKKDLWIAIWINYEYLSEIEEEALAVYSFITPKGDAGFESVSSAGFHWYSNNDFLKTR